LLRVKQRLSEPSSQKQDNDVRGNNRDPLL
jgi:hypothetical protein